MLRPVTPEVAGSSPVAPATLKAPSFGRGFYIRVAVYFAYVLRGEKDGSFCIDHSTDLHERIQRHKWHKLDLNKRRLHSSNPH